MADSAGSVYTAYGMGTEGSAPVPGRLFGLNITTGTLRFQRLGNSSVLAALDRGVLAQSDARLVALAPDGNELWSVPSPESPLRPSRTFVDAAAHRVYFGYGNRLAGVVALDSRSGAVIWQTSARVGSMPLGLAGSAVLVATNARGRTALRAVDPSGRLLWRYRTASQVVGAASLADGTVALSTAGLGVDGGGLLIRIDPRRSAPAVRAARFSLSRASLKGCEYPTGDVTPSAGTVLSIGLPAPATVRVRLLSRPGPRGRRVVVQQIRVPAPAGTSYLRLLVDSRRRRPGKALVQVRWIDRGHYRTLALPVLIR